MEIMFLTLELYGADDRELSTILYFNIDVELLYEK